MFGIIYISNKKSGEFENIVNRYEIIKEQMYEGIIIDAWGYGLWQVYVD